MTVGERIVAAREAKGMSRPDLAKAAGIPYPTLAGLETGDQKTSTALPQIAAALGVDALVLSQGGAAKSAPALVSQTVQWDPAKLALAHQILREAYLDGGREPYSVEREPEALIEAYEWLARQGDAPASVAALGRIAGNRAEKADERQPERTGGTGQKASRKRASS